MSVTLPFPCGCGLGQGSSLGPRPPLLNVAHVEAHPTRSGNKYTRCGDTVSYCQYFSKLFHSPSKCQQKFGPKLIYLLLHSLLRRLSSSTRYVDMVLQSKKKPHWSVAQKYTWSIWYLRNIKHFSVLIYINTSGIGKTRNCVFTQFRAFYAEKCFITRFKKCFKNTEKCFTIFL